jgi:citronellol/citronellal dehydrogenase
VNEASQRYGVSDEELVALPTVFRDGILHGQVALVSGAGTGIGKATACLFARLGGSVAVCGRTEAKLEKTAALLAGLGARVLAVPVNIREPEQVTALFDAVYGEFGRLDILVNNAGGQFPQPAIDFSPKGWRAVVDTNLNGTWYMMQTAAQRWRDRDAPGSIVNIVAPYLRGMYGVAHTVASRAAVAHLARNVAVEWAPYRIRVNCVLPGPISTEGMNVYPPEAQAAMTRGNPMLSFGDVQDIAEACVYLCARSGKFITGEVLVVDGGQQLWGELWLAGKPEYFERNAAGAPEGPRNE